MKNIIAIIAISMSLFGFKALSQQQEHETLFLVCSQGVDVVYEVDVEDEIMMDLPENVHGPIYTGHKLATIKNALLPQSEPITLYSGNKEFTFKQTGPDAFTFKSKNPKLNLKCERNKTHGPVGGFSGTNSIL